MADKAKETVRVTALGLALLLAVTVAGSCKRVKRDPQGGGKAQRPGTKRQSPCDVHRAAIQREAKKAVACKADADFRVVPLAVCAEPPLGCRYGVINPAHAAGLHRAIAAYLRAGCERTKCECPKPPTQTRCLQGTCRGWPRAFSTSVKLGKAAGLAGTFVTPTLNVHWILRMSANGTFSWTNWSHMGGQETKERTLGTWRAIGPARIALKVTRAQSGLQPPKALTVIVLNSSRTLMDDDYVRANRRPAQGQGGRVLVERKPGEKGVPTLELYRDLTHFRRFLGSLKLSP